ncbi:hypothetical protein C8R45DRAFT_173361 [Mycena sanguinolenta]|nr:hypothetical protein C8R45DRAFT_173361 [Mycena sanguinolenta]
MLLVLRVDRRRASAAARTPTRYHNRQPPNHTCPVARLGLGPFLAIAIVVSPARHCSFFYESRPNDPTNPCGIGVACTLYSAPQGNLGTRSRIRVLVAYWQKFDHSLALPCLSRLIPVLCPLTSLSSSITTLDPRDPYKSLYPARTPRLASIQRYPRIDRLFFVQPRSTDSSGH